MWSLARGIEDRGNPTIESRALILADRGCGFLYLVNAMKFMSMSPEEAIAFRDRVMSVLEYDKETGMFKRKIRTSSGCKKEGWFSGSNHSRGYKDIWVLGIQVLCHQLAWIMHYGKVPKYEIDHENGNRSDNRISNLRDIPHCENMKNTKMYKTNTSGHTGVHFDKSKNRWVSSIQVDGVLVNLGAFITKEEAVVVREAANIKHGFHHLHGKRI